MMVLGAFLGPETRLKVPPWVSGLCNVRIIILVILDWGTEAGTLLGGPANTALLPFISSLCRFFGRLRNLFV